MNVMQYRIDFEKDYDMNIIRKRVEDNGNKTDGFIGLLLKAYLIIDSPNTKQYAPLYIWNNHIGMNTFIFEGFYNNILNSFGWQKINTYIPISIELSDNCIEAKYVLEIKHPINKVNSMSYPKYSQSYEHCLGRVLVYNPDTWIYIEYYFYHARPIVKNTPHQVYEILHISM